MNNKLYIRNDVINNYLLFKNSSLHQKLVIESILIIKFF